MKKWQGSKWIRPERRARIYARDKYKCRNCGCRVAAYTDPDRKRLHRAIAVLDHIKPRSSGGTNEDKNLQTSCRSCNCSKQHKVHKEHRPMSHGALFHPGYGVNTECEVELSCNYGIGTVGVVTRVIRNIKTFNGVPCLFEQVQP